MGNHIRVTFRKEAETGDVLCSMSISTTIQVAECMVAGRERVLA